MKKRNSFTLVEVLVALVILMMLVGSMAGIEISNIKLADSGKRQLQATGLARGALNLVRTIRDTNLLVNPTSATVFDPNSGLAADGVGVIKHLEHMDGNKLKLCTNPPVSPCVTNIDGAILDGTNFTIEITIE